MDLLTNEKYDLKELGFSGNTLLQLNNLIDISDYHKHIKAKENFVKLGKKILPVMNKLMTSKYRVIRKEAIKIVRDIGDPSSTQVVIDMLEDPEGDIRWIAAESLINIGRITFKPILEALVTNGESYYLRQGAHHVLKALIKKEDAKELKQLVRVIRHDTKIPETIPVKAALALGIEEIS